MLMDEIRRDSMGAKLNLVGAAIGNGCWGNTVGTCAFSSPEAQQITSDFLFGHGMYSQALHDQVEASCGDFDRLSLPCISALEEVTKQAGTYDGEEAGGRGVGIREGW